MITMSHALSHSFPFRFGARRGSNRSLWQSAGTGVAVALLAAVIVVLGVRGQSQPQPQNWRPTPLATQTAPFNANPDLVTPQLFVTDPFTAEIQQ